MSTSESVVHLLVRTENIPGETEQLIALCGHRGTAKRETSPSLKKVTCIECKVSAMKGVKMQGKRVYPEHEKGFVLQSGEYCNHKSIWFACTPNGLLGDLSNHDVIEHPDGTISVSPSILVTGAIKWHGYLEQGVWREV